MTPTGSLAAGRSATRRQVRRPIVWWALVTLGCACAGPQTREKGPIALSVDSVRGLADSLQAQRYALLIGISRFDDPAWPALEFASKDALDLAGLLEGFGYVRVLTSPDETDRASIKRALADLARRAVDPADTVLIYISSHGTLARGPDGQLARHLVLRDTDDRDIPRSALPVAELLAEVDALRSRRKAVILASCYSGTGKSAFGEQVKQELAGTKGQIFVRPLKEVSEATVVLSASGWGETAREDRNLRNDIYTHFLIEGLASNDRDGDGAVTISEAHDYARYRTYYYTQGRQRPSAVSSIMGMDPIVLRGVKTRQAKPLLYSYADGLEGVEIEVDGESKGVLPGGVAVPPGERLVILRDPRGDRVLATRVVTVGAGEHLELFDLLPRAAELGLMVQGGYQVALAGPRSAIGPGPVVAACGGLTHLPANWLALELCLSVARASVELHLPVAVAPASASASASVVGDNTLALASLGLGWVRAWSDLRLQLGGGLGAGLSYRRLDLRAGVGGARETIAALQAFGDARLTWEAGALQAGLVLSARLQPVVIDGRLTGAVVVLPSLSLAFRP